MKLATLSVPFPGAKRPLEEGAKLGLWSFTLLDENTREITSADIYILAAWHPSYEQLLNLGDKRGVLWTSSAGEMDFTPIERQYLWEILLDPRIDFVWFGAKGLAEAFPQKGFYAPYPLSCDLQPLQVVKEDIATLFCPTKPSKNIYNQLCSMKIVLREWELVLHTNIEGYNEILKDMNVVRYDYWLPTSQYHNLLARAKVNLAVSWAETFNYQVAEALMLGTQSVISQTIPIPGHYVTDPNYAQGIANLILWILEHPPNVDLLRHNLEVRATQWNQDLTERLKKFNLLPATR
jgi:glycosyltransferase involved in cell wall biosynthesis